MTRTRGAQRRAERRHQKCMEIVGDPLFAGFASAGITAAVLIWGTMGPSEHKPDPDNNIEASFMVGCPQPMQQVTFVERLEGDDRSIAVHCGSIAGSATVRPEFVYQMPEYNSENRAEFDGWADSVDIISTSIQSSADQEINIRIIERDGRTVVQFPAPAHVNDFSVDDLSS